MRNGVQTKPFAGWKEILIDDLHESRKAVKKAKISLQEARIRLAEVTRCLNDNGLERYTEEHDEDV